MKTLRSSGQCLSGLIKLSAFVIATSVTVSALGSSPVTEDFSTDSDGGRWDMLNNRLAPQNYGWSNTDFTGSTVNPPGGTATGAGEMGGIITRDEDPDNYYGFNVGGLIAGTEAFEAKGVVRLVHRSGSSGYVLGFFNDAVSYDNGEDPRNFMGFYFDDGHVTYPIISNADRDVDGFNELADDQPDPGDGGGVTLPFSIAWDPAANGGDGAMTASVGTGTEVLNYSGSLSNFEPFTHFGIMAVAANGGEVEVYLDDLTFSSNNAVPEPSSLALLTAGLLSMLWLGRRKLVS